MVRVLAAPGLSPPQTATHHAQRSTPVSRFANAYDRPGVEMRAWQLFAGLVLLPGVLAGEAPTHRRPGFGLFARPLGAITINRVSCGVSSIGDICRDSTNSSSLGGGFWPKGTPNLYIYNSGPQVAGIIGSDGGPWAGDTAGGFFFDDKGTTLHGIGLTDIYNATSAGDRDAWPDEARVPGGAGSLFHSSLQDSISASQGDVWWLMWEGDTSRSSGRAHPLGIAVEVRGLGWNFPSGNEDIVYFVLTYYNITSTDPADYATVRPAVRPRLLALAGRFQAMNNAAFRVTLPVGGYTISPMFTSITADMDVGDAGGNYSSVNLPFSLGYTYDHTFSRFSDWQFDPSISTPPFFAGTGLAGISFLEQPGAPAGSSSIPGDRGPMVSHSPISTMPAPRRMLRPGPTKPGYREDLALCTILHGMTRYRYRRRMSGG